MFSRLFRRRPRPAADEPPLVIRPAGMITVRPGDGIEPGSIFARPREPIDVRPTPAVLVKPAPGLRIEPPARGVWDERGWTMIQQHGIWQYQGVYTVMNRCTRQLHRFPGRILAVAGEIVPYIAQPPAGLGRHPKAPCFMPEQLPWFRVHWHRPARNVDDAILYIEKVLAECLN